MKWIVVCHFMQVRSEKNIIRHRKFEFQVGVLDSVIDLPGRAIGSIPDISSRTEPLKRVEVNLYMCGRSRDCNVTGRTDISLYQRWYSYSIDNIKARSNFYPHIWRLTSVHICHYLIHIRSHCTMHTLCCMSAHPLA